MLWLMTNINISTDINTDINTLQNTSEMTIHPMAKAPHRWICPQWARETQPNLEELALCGPH
jgi:hypothetical protein